MWGYLKDRVYVDKHSTFERLETNIRPVMAEIPTNMCQKMIENNLKKIKASNTSGGGHLSNVVYHT